MGIWLEFRCENRSNPSASGNLSDRCQSHDNSGPTEMAYETREGVLDALRCLGDEARHVGWKRTRYGWICAFCARQPDAMTELKVASVDSDSE